MITRNDSWKHLLASAIRDPERLLQALHLPLHLLPAAREAATHFPLRVPHGYVARMQHGDLNDPLLRQVLPLADESLPVAGYHTDPVGDAAASAGHGLLQKYHGRALLMTTGACAIHCRYCFRRHYPYSEQQIAHHQWQSLLDTLRADSSLSEVILSGGDPLLLDDERLAALVTELAAIPHLQRLRIHTRLPVVLPERIDAALLSWISRSRLQPVMVIHANHVNELDAGVAAALARLYEAGVTLLNQAVLLRGVNDSVAAQCALSESLFQLRVVPYYLHLLDRVAGAAHFDLPEATASSLIAGMRQQLPGYLMPRPVRELAGAPWKVPV